MGCGASNSISPPDIKPPKIDGDQLKDCAKRFQENKDINEYIQKSSPELAQKIKSQPNPPTQTPDQILVELNKSNEKLYKKSKEKAVDILDEIEAIKSVVKQLVDQALEQEDLKKQIDKIPSAFRGKAVDQLKKQTIKITLAKISDTILFEIIKKNANDINNPPAQK